MRITADQANGLYITALIIGVGKPFVYWLFHPELTQMQIWLGHIWYWLTGCLIILVTYLIEWKQ